MRFVAYCRCTAQSWSLNTAGFLSFFVAESERRQKIGENVLGQCLEFLQEAGRTAIFFSSYAPNYILPGIDQATYPDGYAFLEAQGFTALYSPVAMDRSLLGFKVSDEIRLLIQEREQEGYTFRTATDADLYEVITFANRVFNPDWGRAIREGVLQGLPLERIMVAREHDKLVGFCLYGGYEGIPERFGPFGVDPEQQGKGLGKLLLHLCLENMRAEGLHGAWFLWTGEKTAAGHLYKKNRLYNDKKLSGDEEGASMKQQILAFLQKEIDQQHIPGAVIYVKQNDRVLLKEALGYRAYYPKPLPMETNCLFDLASLTKVVVTLPLVLKLLEAGVLRLDDPVCHFLPNFKENDKQDVTIKHLLTHTAGLASHKPFFQEALNAEQVMERIYREPLSFPPGSKVVYSDLGFITLFRLIEVAAEEPFTEYAKRVLFDPLQMSETSFVPVFPKERYAATEFSEELGEYKCGVVHDENAQSMGGVSGHAGLFSTVADLAKFVTMVANGGCYENTRILSESALRLSRENYTPFSPEYRGLGWILNSPARSSCGDFFSRSSYGHTGFTGTSIWFDPDVDLQVILLTNRVHFGRKPAILRLRPRLHNLIKASLSGC